MITCEKDPLQWAVSDDKGNVHRFEQEFQIVLIGILSNLKRLDEMKEMSTEKRAKQIEKLKKDVKDYTFEHNYKKGTFKFQWEITFSKENLAKIYDDPDIYKSDDGFEIGVQQNKVPDRTGNKKARQIRRFESYEQADFQEDPIEMRYKIYTGPEEDIAFCDDDEDEKKKIQNATFDNVIELINCSRKSPFNPSSDLSKSKKYYINISAKRKEIENVQEFINQLNEEESKGYCLNLADESLKNLYVETENEELIENALIEENDYNDRFLDELKSKTVDYNSAFPILRIQNLAQVMMYKAAVLYHTNNRKFNPTTKHFIIRLPYDKPNRTKFDELVECIDMSYISFFVNQHIEALKIANECKTDSESIDKVAEVLDKLQTGYYIIFEMCDDSKHEIIMPLYLPSYAVQIPENDKDKSKKSKKKKNRDSDEEDNKEEVSEEEEERSSKKNKKKRVRHDDDDEEEDDPRSYKKNKRNKRKGNDTDEDDEPKPKKKKRNYSDDDESDEPRSKKKIKKNHDSDNSEDDPKSKKTKKKHKESNDSDEEEDRHKSTKKKDKKDIKGKKNKRGKKESSDDSD